MKFRLAAVIGISMALTGVAVSTSASAQTYERDVQSRNAQARYSRRHYDDCRRAKRSSANKGTLAGALVGGASGALIGGDALGAIVGAGVGAVGGHAIAARRVHC